MTVTLANLIKHTFPIIHIHTLKIDILFIKVNRLLLFSVKTEGYVLQITHLKLSHSLKYYVYIML